MCWYVQPLSYEQLHRVPLIGEGVILIDANVFAVFHRMLMDDDEGSTVPILYQAGHYSLIGTILRYTCRDMPLSALDGRRIEPIGYGWRTTRQVVVATALEMLYSHWWCAVEHPARHLQEQTHVWERLCHLTSAMETLELIPLPNAVSTPPTLWTRRSVY